MAGRSRGPPRHDRRRAPYPPPDLREPPHFPHSAAMLRPGLPHPEAYEEELELQVGEIRRLVAENRQLADDCVGLQRELGATREDLHRMNQAFQEMRAERDTRVRELIDKGMKMEADLRATEPLRSEVLQLRAEVQKLDAVRQEQLKGLNQELDRAKAGAKQISAHKSEIDGLRQELMRTRSAFEYEKKENSDLVGQSQAMQNNLVSMAREVEKLRAELASKDGRNWTPAAGAGGVFDGRPYGAKLNSPERAFPSSYADGYGPHSAVAEKNALYAVGSGSWAGGSYEKPRPARR